MKKISEWLQELPDGYRERALSQILIDTEEESLSEAVWCFNDFDHTKEGYGFWSAVANHCEGIWDLPALPEEASPPIDKCVQSPFTQDAETRKLKPEAQAGRDVSEITDERGKNYGHPYDHFQCTRGMFEIWDTRRADGNTAGGHELSKCLDHIAYMILDKLARAAENPLHMDNFDDIQGYASLWSKCVEKESEKETKGD